MSFEAKDYPISEILNKAVFNIPRNQRRYVWKQENWNDLYEDIVFSVEQEKAHFIGSIVLKSLKKQDGLSYYTIIDGQQRIITITLLLVAVMKLFFEEGMKDDYLGTVSYLQSKNNRNQDMIIIDSEYHSSLRCLTKGILSLDNEPISINAFVNTHILAKRRDKLLGEAVKYFYTTIKRDLSQVTEKHERLREIRNAILEMTAVRIVSSTEEDSYTIFEILNARGQELTPSELLKNYIMRYIQPVDRRDEAKEQWEAMEQNLGTAMNKFIKHYATHRFGDTKNKYGSPYQAIQKATHGQNMGVLLDDIKLKSEYYNKIINPKEGKEGNCSSIEGKIYGFFKVKRFEQFRPILLSLIHQRELEVLNEENYELTIKYIYNFFICYTIIGQEKSNKLEDVVFKYAPMFESEYSENLLEEFAEKLKRKIPSYEWFLNAFKNIGWSNHYDLYKDDKEKKKVQIILEVIEQYVSQRDDISSYTIEHILPDSQSIENAQIGNLIPLEMNLNDACGDKAINEKFAIYSRSQFMTARNLEERYRGKNFLPQNRTQYLARLMYNNILELNQFDFK